MTKLTFKDVAHHYVGCKMLHPDGHVYEFSPMGLYALSSPRQRFKSMPILYPMDKMPESHMLEYPVFPNLFKEQKIEVMKELIRTQRLFPFTPERFLWCVSPDHPYNIFGLGPDQFIDATTLNPNPYENEQKNP